MMNPTTKEDKMTKHCYRCDEPLTTFRYEVEDYYGGTGEYWCEPCAESLWEEYNDRQSEYFV